MPNTREKLIELLTHDDCPIFMVFGDNMEGLADYLIAQGVTFATDNPVGDKLSPAAYKSQATETLTNCQQWIPVTERLPDRDTLVLGIGSKGGMFLGYVRSLYGNDVTAYTIVPNARGGRYTKYWMPLPEPPKGE